MRVEVNNFNDNERFRFDNTAPGELVINAEYAPTVLPEAVCLEGLSYVAEVRQRDGREELAEHNGLGWAEHYRFENGTKLDTIRGYDGFNPLAYNPFAHETMGDIEVRPNITTVSEYDFSDDTLLILAQDKLWTSDAVIQSATEELQVGNDPFNKYLPAAAIEPSGRLVTWGEDQSQIQQRLDLMTAAKLAVNPSEKRDVRRRLGDAEPSGLVQVHTVMRVYLQHLKDNFDTDLLPDTKYFE